MGFHPVVSAPSQSLHESVRNPLLVQRCTNIVQTWRLSLLIQTHALARALKVA